MNELRTCVAILLSTYNGERYLHEQLASFAPQTHTDWLLYWRDDGSTDATPALMQAFSAAAPDRYIPCEPGSRMGATASFLSLLRIALRGPAAFFAFSDQDDVWLPDKLAHGVAAFGHLPADVPALYVCARAPVDAALRPVGRVPALRPASGFPASLIENLAPGCCMILNRAAAALIDVVTVPAETWHDWWAYIVVSAYDGAIITGGTSDILYRQHNDNLVGEPRDVWHRITAAIGRGRRPFMARLWRHVAALQAGPSALPARTHASLTVIERARNGGVPAHIKALRLPGFTRQGRAETWLFRLMFLLG
jgi:Glycosyl transferase family 2